MIAVGLEVMSFDCIRVETRDISLYETGAVHANNICFVSNWHNVLIIITNYILDIINTFRSTNPKAWFCLLLWMNVNTAVQNM